MPVRLTGFEHRQQSGDLQQVSRAADDVDEFQPSALTMGGHVGLDYPAESRAVDVWNASEIDDEVHTAGAELATHDIAQFGLRFSRDLIIRLENGAVRHKTFDDAHGKLPLSCVTSPDRQSERG